MVPLRLAKVSPSSTASPSTWWNMGLCVASTSSRRYTVPGAITYTGGSVVCMVRICTGEVCVRSSTSSCSPPAMKNVSLSLRAGWPSGVLSAVKLLKPVSISGPSATE